MEQPLLSSGKFPSFIIESLQFCLNGIVFMHLRWIGAEKRDSDRWSSYEHVGRAGSAIPTASLAGSEVSVDEIRSAAASSDIYPPSLHAPLLSYPSPQPLYPSGNWKLVKKILAELIIFWWSFWTGFELIMRFLLALINTIYVEIFVVLLYWIMLAILLQNM